MSETDGIGKKIKPISKEVEKSIAEIDQIFGYSDEGSGKKKNDSKNIKGEKKNDKSNPLADSDEDKDDDLSL